MKLRRVPRSIRPRPWRWGTIAQHLGIWLGLLVVLVPILWVVLVSLSDTRTLMESPLFPTGFNIGNYAGVVRRGSALATNLMNSAIVTAATVALTTTCAALGGYALSHGRMAGKHILVAVLVASLFIPTKVVSIVAIWQIQRSLDLINVTWGLILPYSTLTLALGILIMRAVFQGISLEVVEAARMDGAGALRTFWTILLPLASNGLVLVAAATFVAAWGEYLIGAILINDQSRRTLPVVLTVGGFVRPGTAALWIVAILPSVLVAVGAQRWVTRGIQEGVNR